MTKAQNTSNHKPRGQNAKPMARIIAKAAGVNINTVYDLARMLNEKVILNEKMEE